MKKIVLIFSYVVVLFSVVLEFENS